MDSLATKFKRTYLSESPKNTGKFVNNTVFLQDLINDINFYTKTQEPVSLGNDTFKLETPTKIYYWVMGNNKIVLAIVLEKMDLNLVVRMLGKDPAFKNKPPYAYQLFATILKDSHPSIVMSDIELSMDGFKNYEKLFDLGYKISVYDRSDGGNQAGRTFKVFDSKFKMERYFGTTDLYKNYQFIISEEKELGEISSGFTLRRYREFNNSQDCDQ